MGAHVPDLSWSTETVADWASVEPDWIVKVTGIHERRVAPPEQSTSAMSEPAARQALDGVTEPVGALVVATSTPDQMCPPTATALQHRLGLEGCPSFDLNAACGGFVYGMALGRALITSMPSMSSVLLVGADQYTKFVDRSNRTTVPIFGDGAGAVVLGPVPDGYGIHSMALAAYGEHHDEVGIYAGGTREPLTSEAIEAGRGSVHMNGRNVRAVFVEAVPALTRQVVEEAGWKLEDVDRFVFHQGNPVMLRDVARLLGIDTGRVGITADRIGNTGCGSMPLTLHHINTLTPLRRGEKLVFAGAGAGITAGAVALTWW